MMLPANFGFSQASLQDYADCPRRFQLRYVLNVRWPASYKDPIAKWEQRARQGAAFHRLIHQHTTGIPADVLCAAVGEGELRDWWQAYLSAPPRDLPTTIRRSELRLSTPLAGHRLTARYDLLAVEPGQRAVIVDWKTSQSRPRRTWLEKRLQTQVYRYVLVRAGAQLYDREHPVGHLQPLLPEQVELVYWLASFPGQTERFQYDADQHTAVEQSLSAMIAEIAALDLGEWPLASDHRQCKYCPYRTLCDREEVEGTDEEPEDESEEDLFDFDLEQIAEVEF
jgi:CRISPR/Cas system-associated exonuclease Cas4 (RecB family)